MDVLQTPDDRFSAVPDYPFEPHYVEVPDGVGDRLRVHYVEEGPRDAPPVLLLHGEPSWSFLYRKMIPVLVDAGLRAIAPDLVGCGRSDKPAARDDYTYQRHVDWMAATPRRARPRRRYPRRTGLGWAHRPATRRRASRPVRPCRGGQHLLADRRPRSGRRVPCLAALLAGDADLRRRTHRQHRVHERAAAGGRRRLRRTLPRRVVQGRRPPVPPARPQPTRRPGIGRQPGGVGRAAGLDEAVPHRVQRPGSDHRGRRSRAACRHPGVSRAGTHDHRGRGPLPAGGRGRRAGATSSRRSSRRREPPRAARP